MYNSFRKLQTASVVLRENPMVELYAQIMELERDAVWLHNEVIILRRDLEKEKRKNTELKEKVKKAKKRN